MDLNKLTTGDQVIGVSGIVLFIVSFFNWLGFNVNGHTIAALGVSPSASAWHFTLTLLAVLLGLVLLIYVVLKALGVEIPGKFGSVTLAQIVLGIAGIAFLFVLIKVIVGPNAGGTLPAGITKSRKVGIFIGLIATIGLVAGAFLNFQADNATAS
jgi:multisubunit Na+/H+ antiporter MnhF subunit